MNIFRVTNPKGIYLVKDYIVDKSSKEPYTIASEFMSAMYTEPERILFVVAVNEEDGNAEVKAFVIVWIPEGQTYMLLHQVHWIDAKFGAAHPEANEQFMSMIEDFGRLNKIKTMRTETFRKPEAFFRKYNFRKYSTVLERDIGD